MTHAARLQAIRRRTRYHDYLASMPDPASLARTPTCAEREDLERTADLAGARAGAAWAAQKRGIR
jgi:hypothetical protein